LWDTLHETPIRGERVLSERGKHRLTVPQVRNAKTPGRLHDGGGLYLAVTERERPDGSKLLRRSWVLLYTSPAGRRREMGLGSVGGGDAVSLKAARDAAEKARKLLEAGIDPIDHKRAERAAAKLEAANARTFRQAAEEYLAAKRPVWTSPKHAKLWLATLEAYVFPHVGSLPVSALDTSQQGVAYVKRILSPLWHAKPETARRVRQRLEAILEFASAHGWRGAVDNPARLGRVEYMMGGKAARAVKHHPALPYAELPAFMADLRKLEGGGAKALELTILTATRTAETLGARWVEFDLDAKDGAVWIIPAARMKMNRDHRIPLSRQAVALLRDLRKAHPKARFVFPGLGTASHLSGMAMLKVLQRMDRDAITVHGFRSCFRSWVADCTTYPRDVAEAALAHRLGDKTEVAYMRSDLLERRREVMQRWADFADGEAGGNVVEFQSKRAEG
jgi:integrase